MMGRPPKPTALKVLEGQCGHRPLNQNEPKPESVAPKCPAHLRGEARREWGRIVPELLALGLLTRIDKAALAAYCTAWAEYCEASTKARETGLVIKTKQGNIIPNPFLGVAHTAMGLMHKFLTEFGLTPSSRTRLSVQATETDELSAFLNEPTLKLAK